MQINTLLIKFLNIYCSFLLHYYIYSRQLCTIALGILYIILHNIASQIWNNNKRGENNARINEKENRIDNKNTFVAIDVETTGLSPTSNELIEVSAIKYDGNKK